jgi:hypothetical protein
MCLYSAGKFVLEFMAPHPRNGHFHCGCVHGLLKTGANFLCLYLSASSVTAPCLERDCYCGHDTSDTVMNI